MVTPFDELLLPRLPGLCWILIGLVVPDKEGIGFINLQALTLTWSLLLGIGVVLGTDYFLKNILKTTEKKFSHGGAVPSFYPRSSMVGCCHYHV